MREAIKIENESAVSVSRSVVDFIGETPLIRLGKIAPDVPDTVEIHAKAEWLNPGGSVKDRAALRMVSEAIKKGDLSKGRAIMDSSSGNTAIAYAMIGASLGFPVK